MLLSLAYELIHIPVGPVSISVQMCHGPEEVQYVNEKTAIKGRYIIPHSHSPVILNSVVQRMSVCPDGYPYSVSLEITNRAHALETKYQNALPYEAAVSYELPVASSPSCMCSVKMHRKQERS